MRSIHIDLNADPYKVHVNQTHLNLKTMFKPHWSNLSTLTAGPTLSGASSTSDHEKRRRKREGERSNSTFAA